MSKLVDGLFVKSFKAIVNSTKSQQNVQQTNEKNKVKHQQRKSTTMDEVIVEKPFSVNYLRSPPAGRRQHIVVNNEDKKRETKKWSFSAFFRRRKKSLESESSSQEDLPQYNTRKSFMSRKKKSTKKNEKSKKKLVGIFDHIVVPPKGSEYYNSQEGDIMSDPCAEGYNVAYMRRENNLLNNHENIFASIHKPYSGSVETSKSSRESLNVKQTSNTPMSRNESISCNGSYGSLDSSSKKRHRERAKQRRDRLFGNDYHSSSDEGSQRSTASSLIRLKSDSDSGTKMSREVSVNRKTRSARTERYIKRLSREDEHILNKEAEIVKGRYLQRQVSVSPVAQQHVAYLPATHNNSSLQNYIGCGPPCPQQLVCKKPPLSGSYIQQPHENTNTYIPRNANSHNDIYGKIWSHQDNHLNNEAPVLSLQRTTPDSYYMPKKKSWSLESNIHRSSPINSEPSNISTNDSYTCYIPPNYTSPRPYVRSPPEPYINSTYQKNTVPPPPPPRDPQRRVIPPTVLNGYDSFQRPMSYAFETNNQRPSSTNASQTSHTSAQQQLNSKNIMSVDRTSSIRSINSVNYPPLTNGEYQNISYMNNRSNSDDHIIQTSSVPERIRPASVNPEAMMNGNEMQQPSIKRYITRNRSNPTEQTKYQFFTDQVPRSRKPIHIVPIQNDHFNQYLSDSQVDFKYKHFPSEECRSPKIQSVTEFWKQKEKEEAERKAEANQMKKNIRMVRTPDEQNSPKISTVRTISSTNSSPMNSLTRNIENIDKATQSSPKNFENTSNISSPYNSLKRRDSSSFRPLSMVLEKPENESKPIREPPVPPVRRSSRQSSTSSTEMAADWLNNENNSKKSLTETVTLPVESPIPAPRKSLMQNANGKDDQNSQEPVIKEKLKIQPRKSTNLEDALNELEEIYKSLQLGDEDLLDRAERRDIPTFRRKLAGTSEVDGRQETDKCSTSSSMESFMDEVALPRRKQHISRRSAIPDTTTDDMAYRKMHRNDLSPSVSSPKDSALSQVSYLLASPDLSLAPTPDITEQLPSNSKEPDITLDDVVYRNLKHVNNTLKIVDPQPPFGIPIGPVTTAPNSDYLHAKPENRPRSRFIPQKIPDIVKDDLAFRSLRKDVVKDPLLSDDFKNNNNNNNGYHSHPLDVRKKRAVRSLSANLYNIIQRETDKFTPIPMEKTSSLTNMDETIQIKPTKKLFDLPTSSETLIGSQNNVLSDSELGRSVEHRLRVYIPKGGNQESDTDIEIRVRKSTSPRICSAHTTPLTKSPEHDVSDFNKSEFETLLINLAKETQEESKKLEIELEKLSNKPMIKTNKNDKNDENNKNINNNKKLNIEKTLTDINSVSEHAKLCEKLLECVVESTDLISSKMPETEQIQSGKDEKLTKDQFENITSASQCKNNKELMNDINNASDHAQLCNKLLECVVESTELVTPKTSIIVEKSNTRKTHNNTFDNNIRNPENRIMECVVECMELIPIKPEMIKISDVEDSVDEGVIDLDQESDNIPKVATATELTTDDNEVVELFNPISVLESTVANVILLGQPESPSEVILDYVDSDRISLIKSDDYENLDEFITSTDLSDSNETLDGDKTPTQISNQDLLEDLVTNQSIPLENNINLSQTTKNYSTNKEQVLTKQNSNKSGSCNLLTSSTTNSPPTLLSRPCTSTVSDDDESPWYKDSKSLALACAYVLACTHQLASTDIITIIGIILAVISVLAALVM